MGAATTRAELERLASVTAALPADEKRAILGGAGSIVIDASDAGPAACSRSKAAPVGTTPSVDRGGWRPAASRRRVDRVDQSSAAGPSAGASGATTASAAWATAFLRDTFFGAAGAMEPTATDASVSGAPAERAELTGLEFP